MKAISSRGPSRQMFMPCGSEGERVVMRSVSTWMSWVRWRGGADFCAGGMGGEEDGRVEIEVEFESWLELWRKGVGIGERKLAERARRAMGVVVAAVYSSRECWPQSGCVGEHQERFGQWERG